MFLQNDDGQMLETHSVAAGLDYVGVSPILADLAEQGRVRFESATDDEVMAALDLTMRMEGIIPALESTHAFVQAFKEAPELVRTRRSSSTSRAGATRISSPSPTPSMILRGRSSSSPAAREYSKIMRLSFSRKMTER